MDVGVYGPDIPRLCGLKGMFVVNEKQKLYSMSFCKNLSAVSIVIKTLDNIAERISTFISS